MLTGSSDHTRGWDCVGFAFESRLICRHDSEEVVMGGGEGGRRWRGKRGGEGGGGGEERERRGRGRGKERRREKSKNLRETYYV